MLNTYVLKKYTVSIEPDVNYHYHINCKCRGVICHLSALASEILTSLCYLEFYGLDMICIHNSAYRWIRMIFIFVYNFLIQYDMNEMINN